MRKEILYSARKVAGAIRFRLPIPYEGKVVEIESPNAGITGFYNMTVEVSGKRRVILQDIRGSSLAGVKPGDQVRVSREVVIFGSPKIEKLKE